MHGHGFAPPPQRPSTALPVVLRVIFVLLAVFSCGLLAWAPLLRLAILTREVRDWVLFGVSFVLIVTSLILIGAEPTQELDTGQEYFGLVLLLGGGAAIVAYYLFAEIRHFSRPHPQPHAGYAPTPPPPAYGYPQPGPAPHQQTTHTSGPPPHIPPQPLHPQAAQAHLHPHPQPHPHPQRPAPARIDQVRAELDELSSLLRKQDEPRERPEGEPR
ncbi:hypothetical protein ACFQVC_37490 [Streptomyces monticola]|uniref:Integral membrane protein n=1 Tax=Streptomyces monticola TaxID=2666263 RepID=A0ABW2JVV4_9ACTN